VTKLRASPAGQEPRQEGVLWKWTVGRSATIGTLFSRVKKRRLVFPRVQDCGGFLDELAGEIAEYDDINRTTTRISEELHNQYVLGFTPQVLDGKVHKLAIRVKQAGMTARARRSYLAASEKPTQ